MIDGSAVECDRAILIIDLSGDVSPIVFDARDALSSRYLAAVISLGDAVRDISVLLAAAQSVLWDAAVACLKSPCLKRSHDVLPWV